jgi:carbon storage regulator
MLVLSRKVGEEIIIGDNIHVRVLSIQGNSIRLGFDAPRGVPIQRSELLDKVRSAQKEMAKPLPTPDVVIDVQPSQPPIEKRFDLQ